MSNQQTGRSGEDLAVTYLQQHGFAILERNFFTRYAEIDIVALKNSMIYFFEVKARHTNQYGNPLETISKKKIFKIKQAGEYYVARNKQEYAALAVGVIGLLLDRENQIKKVWCIENVDL